MSIGDPAALAWRKSSFSGSAGTNCVEVAVANGWVAVRDSKQPAGPVLVFTWAEWTAFVLGIRVGEF